MDGVCLDGVLLAAVDQDGIVVLRSGGDRSCIPIRILD